MASIYSCDFLGRIGVVEAQIAVAAEFLRHAEVQADRFGVADMQIAVRLRRKPGDDGFVPAGGKIGTNDVADEILTRFPYRRFRSRHDLIASVCRGKACGAPGLDKLGCAVKPARPKRKTKPKPVYFHSYLAVLHERASARNLNGP